MLPVLFLLTTLMSTVQHEWTWQSHPEAGFKILSPKSLGLSITEVPTPSGPVKYHQYTGGSLADSSLELAFVVDYYTLPLTEEATDPLYFRDFFENTVDQILTSLDGSLAYIDITADADREICIWKASYQDKKGIIRGKLIIADGKYYGLQVFGLAENKPDDLMNKFLDSFRLMAIP